MANEVKAFLIGGKLVESNIMGSAEIVAYRADGKLYKTKEEADRVNAEWDLKHLLDRLGFEQVSKEIMSEFFKSNRKEFLEILSKL